ncbi:testis-expressed protein 36 [Dunckerocampus dactyliophorus]|uniref:testis-expressed protein 36 n=1 Tax=Dunckerocampus dactyliophorus TaxID=161453 RepID=UPI002405E50F|nr:testis-expressed protein 36 [Dunckerocampus dactyliophorus]
MVKSGKRYYSSKANGGKWFPHPDVPRNEGRDRELSTSTGLMLTQVNPSLPQALSFERFPKWRLEQKSRAYPVSNHDNRLSYKDNILVFDDGAGRRKCPSEVSLHRSHFCLCQGPAMVANTVYQADFATQPTDDVPTGARRFARDHKNKCEEAALAQGGGDFMWFGQHNRAERVSMEVLGFANLKTSIRP